MKEAFYCNVILDDCHIAELGDIVVVTDGYQMVVYKVWYSLAQLINITLMKGVISLESLTNLDNPLLLVFVCELVQDVSFLLVLF